MVENASQCQLGNLADGDVGVDLRDSRGKTNALLDQFCLDLNNDGLERKCQGAIVGELDDRIWTVRKQRNGLLLGQGEGLVPGISECLRLHNIRNQGLHESLNAARCRSSQHAESLLGSIGKIQGIAQTFKEGSGDFLDVDLLVNDGGDLSNDGLLNSRVLG